MFLANKVRQMLDAIYRFNCSTERAELLAAWGYLTAAERAAYKKVLDAVIYDVR